MFDRIIHTIAILMLMAFELISSQARILLEVLQQCEHCIKTGYGVSAPVYGGETG